MQKPKLLLYYKESCPYCQKVLNALDDMGKVVPLADIAANPKNRDTLIEIAGRKTVPCLMIDGVPMHESDDIIVWLTEHADFLESDSPLKRL